MKYTITATIPLMLLFLSCADWPSSTRKSPEEVDWDVSYPVWVSDSRIAALVQPNIAYEGAYIYEFDALTGENLVCLTEKDSLAKINLVVSRDRTKLAYGAADAGRIFSAQQLFVFDRVTGKVSQVTQGGHQEHPEFSPDGSMLIYDSGYRTAPPQNGGEIGAGKVAKVHIQNIDGSGRRPIDPSLLWGDKDGHFLADGKHIVLRTGRTSHLTATKRNSEVYLTDIVGSTWTNLSIEDYGTSFPRPSVDGKQLLYYSPAGFEYPGDDPRDDPPGLKLLDLEAVMNGTNNNNPLPYKALRFPYNWTDLVWSPDGKWIAFRSPKSDSDDRIQVFIIHPDGSQFKQLTTDEHCQSISWSPDSKRIAFWSYSVKDNMLARRITVIDIPSGAIHYLPLKLSFKK